MERRAPARRQMRLVRRNLSTARARHTLDEDAWWGMCVGARPFTLRQVNRLLDDLAQIGQEHRRANVGGATAPSQSLGMDASTRSASSVSVLRKNAMEQFMKHATPLEHRWFVAILLRDLKASVKETSVWRAFHPQAEEYFHRCVDIEKLCKDLHSQERIHLVNIQVGQHCSVMLAERTKQSRNVRSCARRMPKPASAAVKAIKPPRTAPAPVARATRRPCESA
jgi:hypothetical protein